MSNQPVLELSGVSKRYPGVVALDSVDFTLMRGEVHCLIGENGAGKSTLVRVITGAGTRDTGEIKVKGRRVETIDARFARELGISAIYQEMNLVPAMSVVENIFLGNEQSHGLAARIDWRSMRERTRAVLAELRVDIDPDSRIDSLSTAEQQVVEIAKALVLEKEILIMDEPTASLSQQNTEELFRIIHQLKTKGVSIIYISHRLQELSQIGDRVTVLRDGRRVGTFRLGEVALPELIQMMVGRKLTDQPVAKSKVVTGRPLLEVNELAWLPKIKGVSFSVRKGEIVGFAGLVGAGRTDLMRLIFGAESSDSGKVTLDGRTLTLRTPADAVRNGIGMLTEDRKGQGLVMGMSIRQNISLANLARFVRVGRISKTLEKEAASREVKALRIATPSIEHLVGQLSGGNQQKVVLAKWLTTSCRVLIFDEPTRGIDVGAKAEIYEIMRDLAAKGMAIIMVSSDLPEILRVSDRVIVMAGGRITGELPRGEATQERIMELMLGGAGDVA